MQKATLLARQRQAIDFSSLFVITDIDVENRSVPTLALEAFNEARIEKVLSGFDPTSNEPDRHILREILGKRYIHHHEPG